MTTTPSGKPQETPGRLAITYATTGAQRATVERNAGVREALEAIKQGDRDHANVILMESCDKQFRYLMADKW